MIRSAHAAARERLGAGERSTRSREQPADGLLEGLVLGA